MIQINANLPSEVQVDFDMSGNELQPILRLYFICSDFFVGFDGTDNIINMPPLNNISFPSIVKAKIEVILGNYNIPIWSENVEIIQDNKGLQENYINTIKINVKLKHQETIDPKIKVKPL